MRRPKNSKLKGARVRKLKDGTELQFKDKGGNVLICKHTDDSIFLSLKLKTEGRRRRHIGTIKKQERLLVIKRNRGQHLFTKMHAYGFNYRLLRDTTRFDKIMLIDEFGTFIFDRSLVLEHGKIMNFINSSDEQSYELQIFLHLDYITNKETEGAF